MGEGRGKLNIMDIYIGFALRPDFYLLAPTRGGVALIGKWRDIDSASAAAWGVKGLSRVTSVERIKVYLLCICHRSA